MCSNETALSSGTKSSRWIKFLFLIGPITCNKDSPEDYEIDTSLWLITIEDIQPQGNSKFLQLSQRTFYHAVAIFDIYTL